MPDLRTSAWSQPGSRVYETGVDRAVLYFKDGDAVPWNGLRSIDESLGQSTNPVFYDGIKLSEIQSSKGFSASVTAVTHPEELDEVSGSKKIRNGIHIWDQPSSTFGFTYRTLVGNDIEGLDAGYKIHLIYNVSATKSNVNYRTSSDEVSPTEFSWDFAAIPEHLEGYRASTHIIIDTSKASPTLVQTIESYIYGTETSAPYLPPMQTLIALALSLSNFINITDNGDGTWTASTDAPGYINALSSILFEIQEANVEYLDPDTYVISPTTDPP